MEKAQLKFLVSSFHKKYLPILRGINRIDLEEIVNKPSDTFLFIQYQTLQNFKDFQLTSPSQQEPQPVSSIADKESLIIQDFDYCKQPHAIIILTHYDDMEKVEILGYIQALKQNFPQLSLRIFAFEQPEEQSKPLNMDKLIPIPNQEDKIEFYLHTFIVDLCQEVVQKIQNWAQMIDKKQFIPLPLKYHERPAGKSAFGLTGSQNLLFPDLGTNMPNTLSSLSLEQIDKLPTPVQPSPITQDKNNTLSESNSGLSKMSETLKESKKVIGRKLKLAADCYLITGEWKSALQNYQNAMEAAKGQQDFIYYADALEGFICCQMILLQNENDLAKWMKFIKEDLEEKTNEILLNYSKSEFPFLQTKAALEFAHLYLQLFFLFTQKELKKPPSWFIFEQKLPRLQEGDNFISGPKVSQMIMRCWSCGVEKFNLIDQILVATQLASLFQKLNYKRKFSFFIRQVGLLLLPLINQQTTLFIGDEEDGKFYSFQQSVKISRSPQKAQSEILFDKPLPKLEIQTSRPVSAAQVMMTPLMTPNPEAVAQLEEKLILKTDQNLSQTEDVKVVSSSEWISLLAKFAVQSMFRATEGYGLHSTVEKPKSRFSSEWSFLKEKRKLAGWPILQMDICREAIELAKTVQDFEWSGKFMTLYINHFYSFLSPKEQKNWIQELEKLASKLIYFPYSREMLLGLSYLPLPTILNIKSFNMEPNELIKEMTGSLFRPLSMQSLVKRVGLFHSTNQFQPPSVYYQSKSKEEKPKTQAGPFLYNPYEKKALEVLKEIPIVVQGEQHQLELEFWNPLSVQLQIEQLSFLVDAPFELENLSIKIDPFLLQEESGQSLLFTLQPQQSLKIPVHLISQSAGDLHIYGILVKLSHGWVEYFSFNKQGLTSSNSEYYSIKIIPKQPVLKFLGSDQIINEKNILLWIGEQKELEFKFLNISEQTPPINYLKVSCFESNEPKQPKKSDEEVYEMLQLSQQPAFQWSGKKDYKLQTKDKEPLPLSANEEICLLIDAYGKLGCQKVGLEIIYGHQDTANDGFYYRKFHLDLHVTVHEILKPLYFDFLPFWYKTNSHSLLLENQTIPKSDIKLEPSLSVEEMLLIERPEDSEEEYCLFCVDIQNQWPVPLYLCFHLNESEESNEPDIQETLQFTNRLKDDDQKVQKKTILIHSKLTKRIAIPVKKFHLRDWFKKQQPANNEDFLLPVLENDVIDDILPIPVHRNQQFVVHKEKVSYSVLLAQYLKQQKLQKEKILKKQIPDSFGFSMEFEAAVETERWQRLLFWFKDQFFKRCLLKVEWIYTGHLNTESRAHPSRKGQLELRHLFQMTPQMLKHLRLPPVYTDIQVIYNEQQLKPINKFRYRLKMENEPLQIQLHFRLCTRMTSKTRSDFFILRLQPYEETNESERQVLFDVSREMFVFGTLQTILTLNQSIQQSARLKSEKEWRILFLSKGTYQVLWHLEEWNEQMNENKEVIWCPEPLTFEIE